MVTKIIKLEYEIMFHINKGDSNVGVPVVPGVPLSELNKL